MTLLSAGQETTILITSIARFLQGFQMWSAICTAAFQWPSNIKNENIIKISGPNSRCFYSHKDIAYKLSRQTVDDYLT